MPAAGRQPHERWQDVAVAGQRPALPVDPRHAWMTAQRHQPPPPAFQ
ncbi:hypothetical protein predicted by Glimmer/Critica [Stenotrophomonas maltophilia RA8]|nr:hypothetical protein predicted by Glimmer/Critica [Stenotrophomonas maltophilia RA8]